MRTRATSVRHPATRRCPRRVVMAISVPPFIFAAAMGWQVAAAPAQRSAAPTATIAAEAKPLSPQRPTTTISFADGCLTSECHPTLTQRTHVHAPIAAKACDACHLSDAGNHTYPLRAPVQAMCTGCHTFAADAPPHHRSMAVDACLACHDPHASSSDFLLVGDSIGATCATCHTETPGRTKHAAYAQALCAQCHVSHGVPNPMLLTGGDAADHCASCHQSTVDAMTAASHSHLKVDHACMACHTGHASEVDNLLKEETRTGCITCHNELGAIIDTATVSHDAVLTGDQCVSCHEPHASGDPMMLKDDQTHVCLKCHSSAVKAHDGRTILEMATAIAAAPVVHGAVSSGRCSTCHSVHGGNHARLLTQLAPDALVGNFDISNYALCFACHDKGLVLSDSPAATQFRDADRNLHKLHTKTGERGRSCSTCHSVHVGDQPRLIVTTVRYEGSDWKAPMGFELTTNGGRCASACHEPLEYNRAKRAGGAR